MAPISYRRDAFDPAEYGAVEPSDEQTIEIVRGLAHACIWWVTTTGGEYETGRTIESLILDVLEANGASDPQFTRDECVALARFFGLAV